MAEETYPFVGRWKCDDATFEFTASTYNDGTSTRDILGIEAEGSGFILTLPGEQEVIVSEFDDTGRMVWLYWSTGERRVCQRL